MWIITKTGFVSLVKHDARPGYLRARARRAEHLRATFDLTPGDIKDFGPRASDYRYHADVPTATAAVAMLHAVSDIDYTSHVKESVTGGDDVFYRAMMGCWRALHRLQDDGLAGWNEFPNDVDDSELEGDDDWDLDSHGFGSWKEPLSDEEWETFQKATRDD